MPRDTTIPLYNLSIAFPNPLQLTTDCASAVNDNTKGHRVHTTLTALAMITRKLGSFHSFSSIAPYICRRCLHKHVEAGKVPDPTPFVPDQTTFLTLIGRQLSKHASKFESLKNLLI